MRKWISLILIALLMAGCSPKSPEQPSPQPDEQPVNKEEVAVTLYYANKEYVNTGDESKEKFITVDKKMEKDNELFMTVLTELQKDPNIENAETQLANLKFLDVTLKDKTVYVDISSEDLGGSSLQEFYVIGQIVYSLTSIEEVEKVEFLVDGKEQESLMGHYTINKPFDKNTQL
ncbi:GerMN domain-containing protein [Clostridiaceae bacterium 35-E11]